MGKKDEIFQMFDNGLDPTKKEVLERLSKPTAYAYYREWLLIQISRYAMQNVVTKNMKLDVNYLKKVLKALKTGVIQRS